MSFPAIAKNMALLTDGGRPLRANDSINMALMWRGRRNINAIRTRHTHRDVGGIRIYRRASCHVLTLSDCGGLILESSVAVRVVRFLKYGGNI